MAALILEAEKTSPGSAQEALRILNAQHEKGLKQLRVGSPRRKR